MKKILLTFIFLTLILLVNGQTKLKSCGPDCNPPNEKSFMTYYTIGGGISPFSGGDFKGSNWLSVEAGCWGINKPVMYGVSMDFTRNSTDSTSGKLTDNFWIGMKPYYQIYQAENYYLFTYFGPKLNLRNGDVLIDTGLMNYTNVGKHIYTSYGVGLQFFDGKVYPGLNIGFNLVY